MSLFKKEKEKKEMTLQDVEVEFNKLQFEVGSFNYLIDLKSQEINIYNDEINKRLEAMRKLAQKGNLLRGKIENELKSTIKQGSKGESSFN
jgi:tricorn protease-like protein